MTKLPGHGACSAAAAATLAGVAGGSSAAVATARGRVQVTAGAWFGDRGCDSL